MTVSRLVRILVPPARSVEGARGFAVRVFAYLCLAFLGFFVLIWSVPAAVAPAVVSTAWLSTQLIRWFGVPATLNGITIELPSFHFTMIYECTAIYSSLIFLSCILAYPASLKRKAVGAAWGIPVIVAVNVVRVAVLAIVGNGRPRYFDLLHGYLWQVTIILVVVALWVVWLVRVPNDE